jgi:hypothetical protein
MPLSVQRPRTDAAPKNKPISESEIKREIERQADPER